MQKSILTQRPVCCRVLTDRTPRKVLRAKIVCADAGEARVLAMDGAVGYSFRMCNGEDCRFPARMRLKRQTDFERVFHQGRTWKGKYFQFRVLATSAEARMGIGVSRRFGNAVERNRVKRMIREVFRCHKTSFFGVDFIVQPSTRCKSLHAAEIECVLLEEFSLAMATEVKDGKRSNLPDDGRTRVDAGGTRQGKEDPVRRDT